jgi:hypothetical protein
LGWSAEGVAVVIDRYFRRNEERNPINDANNSNALEYVVEKLPSINTLRLPMRRVQ